MLHPSYTDLMNVINSEVEAGEHPLVTSRYSVVIAAAKRARQLIDGAEPTIDMEHPKAMSIAVEELHQGEVKIVTDNEYNHND